MCTSLSMVGRQRWKREGERWGWLNGSGSSGGSGDKGGRAGGTHGGSDGASIAPREIMNENGRAANTTACYLAATAYGFLPLSLSLSLSDTGRQLLSLQQSLLLARRLLSALRKRRFALMPFSPSLCGRLSCATKGTSSLYNGVNDIPRFKRFI